MDIRGIGESLSTTLYNEGLVGNPADLYYLKEKREALVKLEGLADKSADNILKAIEQGKDRPLDKLIFALGIRHVGSETAEELTRYYSSLKYDNPDSLANASAENLSAIDGIGPKITESITAFFKLAENRKIIEDLGKARVTLEKEKDSMKALPLAGQEFVITGRLDTFSRLEAAAKVRELEGTVKENVTRQTRYLVTGAAPGDSKLTRARELGTKQIDEAKFLDILENAKE